jgi:sigma-B regulation protein RsbU (phosphoserine phosphatase)
MWGIPADVLASRDDERLLASVVSLLADPQEFFRRVGYLYLHPHESSQEEVELRDGRVFERYSAPVLGLGGKVLGRVWFFHDVTQRYKDQAALLEAERRAAVARLERELAIAQQIQTSILPKEIRIAGLELAARMVTASEVGGDYYDVHPVADGGCWIGIGDVSGHGLNAGIIMLMVQSSVASLVGRDPSADPAELVTSLNRTLFENIRKRLGLDDFVTFSLMRCFPDGRIVVAGAHEDILVWRAAQRRCETIPTKGTWLGATAEVQKHTQSTTYRLDAGDVLLLHTDGITEARSKSGEMFGVNRLRKVLEEWHTESVEAICHRVHSAVGIFTTARMDDQTVVAMRRVKGS